MLEKSYTERQKPSDQLPLASARYLLAVLDSVEREESQPTERTGSFPILNGFS